MAAGAAASIVHFASGARTLSNAQLSAPPITSASPENASRTRAAAARSGSKLMLAIRSLTRCSARSSAVDDSAASSSASASPDIRSAPPPAASVPVSVPDPDALLLLSESLLRISKPRTLFAASFAALPALFAESAISSKDEAAPPAPTATAAVLVFSFLPKTFAIAWATRFASAAMEASMDATRFSSGRKVVAIVMTAWPKLSLMSPSVFFSCCMRPVGVLASAAFIPPTLWLTTSASVAARCSSVPNFRIFSWASSNL